MASISGHVVLVKSLSDYHTCYH